MRSRSPQSPPPRRFSDTKAAPAPPTARLPVGDKAKHLIRYRYAIIHTGSNIGRLAKSVIRTFTFMLRQLPVTYCWQASASSDSNPCRANGRAYFRGTTNRSKVMFRKSIFVRRHGGCERSNGISDFVSAPVSAALAPTNSPLYSPSCDRPPDANSRRPHRHMAAVGRPISVRVGIEHPIRNINRRHLHDRRLRRQVSRPPKSLPQPLPHRRYRLIARNHKRHHAVGRNLLGVGFLVELFRSAERTAQRLRAGVITHRRPATPASEVVRGQNVAAGASLLAVRCSQRPAPALRCRSWRKTNPPRPTPHRTRHI